MHAPGMETKERRLTKRRPGRTFSRENEDLEWKIVYVGSAEDEQYDQTLDSVLVGPVGVGSYRFVFQANPPDWTKIPPMDITGVTVILLTCAYRGKEFIRVGYYVNNEYVDEQLQQEPPQVPEIEKIQRSILADKPRVTKFPISFDDVEEERNNTTMYAAAPPPENNDAEAMQV